MPTLQSPSFDWWRHPPALLRAPAVPRPREVADAPLDLAFWALVGLTVILIGAPQEYVPALAPLRIALVAASAAAAAHLATRLRDRGAVARVPAPEVPITAVLVVWAVVTIPASLWPGGSVQTLTELYVKSVIAFWLIGEIVSSTRRLRILLWTMSLLIVPLSLTALGSFRSGALTAGRITGYGGGLTSNPNDLALMLNIILPLTGALALTARRRAARVAAAGLALLAAASIVVTFSRAGFLTMLFTSSLFVPLLVRRKGWAPVVLLAVLLLGALPFLPLGYLARVQTVFVGVDADPTGSSQERWRDTVAALEHVRAHPIIGAGLGMDILALNEIRGKHWMHVHDAYLNYAVDLGLPGLLLFVALIGASIQGARAAERRAADPELSACAAGIRIGLCGYALAALFHPTAYHFYFYYLAGLAVAVRRLGAGRRTGARQAAASRPAVAATSRP